MCARSDGRMLTNQSRPPIAAFLVLATMAFLATSCSADNPTAPGTIKLVAAENFYGALAREIGGSHVDVTSILSNPDADPHLFQPGTSTGQEVAVANVVVMNGLGYDDWMNRLMDAAPSKGRIVVSVADVVHQAGVDPNPHLWYDALQMPQVVDAIASALERVDPSHAAAYKSGAQQARASIASIANAVVKLRKDFGGADVAYTERVPGLLLSDAGMNVLTPPSFARSIEDGTDPAPADIAAMQELLTSHRVKVLLYNNQATSPITDQLQGLARAEGIPVVPVSETLPRGQTFAFWQLHQIASLRAALKSSLPR